MGNMWIVLATAFSQLYSNTNAFVTKGTEQCAYSAGYDYLETHFAGANHTVTVVQITDEFILRYVVEKFGVNV